MNFHSIIGGLKQSLVVALSLCLVCGGGDFVQAADIIPESLVGVSALPQFQLVPPARLGRIADYYNAPAATSNGPKPLVILIQDLHAHYGVQKNIAGLLDFIASRIPSPLVGEDERSSGGGTNGVTASPHQNLPPQGGKKLPFALAVEGAQGPLDSSVLATFPDRAIKAQAADYLMRQGELTGAEHFAVMRGIPTLLTGVENETYYTLNRELFRKTIADRQELVAILHGLQSEIAPLQEKIYSGPLLEFQKKVDAYDKGVMGTLDFIGLLTSSPAVAGGGSIQLKRDFPILATFAANAHAGNLNEIHRATASFLNQIQTQLSAQEKNDLRLLAKREGTTPYYLYLRELVYQKQLFLAVPPELAQYMEFIHTTETLGMDRVAHEVKELAFRTKLHMAVIPSPPTPLPHQGEGGRRPGEGLPAVNLIQVQHDLDLLTRIADLQASQYEVQDFGPRLNQFMALCQSLMAASGAREFDEAKVRALVTSSIDYYAMALMRNQPMIDNTLKLVGEEVSKRVGNSIRRPAVSYSPTHLLPHSPHAVVLVAGGFHTLPLTALLRQKNISYVVITPTVDSITDADHELYVKRLKGDVLTVNDVLAADPSAFGAEPVSRMASFLNFPRPRNVGEGGGEGRGLAAGLFLVTAGVGAVALAALARASAHGAVLDPSHLSAALNHLTTAFPAWAHNATREVGSMNEILGSATTALTSVFMFGRPSKTVSLALVPRENFVQALRVLAENGMFPNRPGYSLINAISRGISALNNSSTFEDQERRKRLIVIFQNLIVTLSDPQHSAGWSVSIGSQNDDWSLVWSVVDEEFGVHINFVDYDASENKREKAGIEFYFYSKSLPTEGQPAGPWVVLGNLRMEFDWTIYEKELAKHSQEKVPTNWHPWNIIHVDISDPQKVPGQRGISWHHNLPLLSDVTAETHDPARMLGDFRSTFESWRIRLRLLPKKNSSESFPEEHFDNAQKPGAFGISLKTTKAIGPEGSENLLTHGITRFFGYRVSGAMHRYYRWTEQQDKLDRLGSRYSDTRRYWIQEEFAPRFEKLLFLLAAEWFEGKHAALDDAALAQVRRDAAKSLGTLARETFDGLLSGSFERLPAWLQPILKWTYQETTPFWLRALLHFRHSITAANATVAPHREYNQAHRDDGAALALGATLNRNSVPLLPFVAAMQTHTRAELAEHLRRDTIVDILGRVSRKSLQSITGAYQALVYHQFTNLDTRPIIELLLNAIDTEERYHYRKGNPDHAKNVHWTVEDGRTVIRDEGEGIAVEDLTKLLYPAEGGNLGQAGTTGRFGAGFLSILSYLQGGNNGEHRIVIRSVKGNEKNRFEFYLDKKGILMMDWTPLGNDEAADLGDHGTEIEIVSNGLKRDALIAEAQKTLHAKQDATIWMDKAGEAPTILNSQEHLETLASVPMQELEGEPRSVRPALLLRADRAQPRTKLNEKTEIQVMVNGVYFYSFEVETYDQPKIVVVDFQKDVVDYARDRSTLIPNRLTMNALDILMRTMPDALAIKRAPILLEIASHFERRLPASVAVYNSHKPSEALEKKVRRSLPSRLERVKILGLDPRLQSTIDSSRAAVIFLPKSLIPEDKRSMNLKNHEDADGIIYLPFDRNSQEFAVVSQEGVLVVDERLAPYVRSEKTRSELLAILQAIGTVSQSAYGTPAVRLTETLSENVPVDHSAEMRQPVSAKKLSPEDQLRARIKNTFVAQMARATTLRQYAILNEWISDLLFSSESPESADGGYNLSQKIAKGFDFSLSDSDAEITAKVGQIISLIRFDEEGAPIKPAISRKAEELVQYTPSFNYEDQTRLFNHAGEDTALIRDLVVWIAYYYMKNNVTRSREYNVESNFRSILIANPILCQLSQAVNPLLPPDFYTTSFADAAFRLIKTRYPTFNKPFSKYRFFALGKPLDKTPVYFERLPFHPVQGKFEYVYQALFLALIEKEKIQPNQIEALLNAALEAQRLLDNVFQELSEQEALELATSSSFQVIGNLDLAGLKKAIQTPGKLHAKMLPLLFLHFADTPAVGKVPQHTIEVPDGKALSMPLSTLIYAHASSDSDFDQINNLSGLDSFLEKTGMPNSQEIVERAQSAIKRAYEQTTDGLAFLREMATNGYEASRKQKKNSPNEFRVSSWIDNEGRFILSMEDSGIGMSLQDVIGNLLQPNVSGWDSELRHFGQGFFTLFRGADQVRLQSTRDGITTVAYLVPLIKSGTLIDVQVRLEQRPAQIGEVGTRMEWVKASSSPAYLGAQIWTELNKYVGLFDPAKMTIYWNGEILNNRAEHLVSLKAGNGDEVSISEAAGIQAFNLNQVYMRPLGLELAYPIPKTIREWLVKHGIIMNLDSKSAEPLEGRTDFVGRTERVRELRSTIAVAGLRAALKLLIDGKLDLSELPEDWILNAESYAPRANGNPLTTFIAGDAQQLAGADAADALIDWSPYIDGKDADRNSLMLLLSVPAVPLNGKNYSVFDLIIEGKKDPSFKDQLPSWLKSAIEKALAGKNMAMLMQRTQMDEAQLETINPTTVDPQEDHAAILRAWQSLVEHILSLGGVSEQRLHQFYAKPNQAIAHTNPGRNNIAWNIASIHSQLKTLHDVLKSTTSGVDPARLAQLLYRLIETTTHEETHIERGEGEAVWTHNKAFYENHLVILNRMLRAYAENQVPQTLINAIDLLRQELGAQLGSTLAFPQRFVRQEHESAAVTPVAPQAPPALGKWQRFMNWLSRRRSSSNSGDSHGPGSAASLAYWIAKALKKDEATAMRWANGWAGYRAEAVVGVVISVASAIFPPLVVLPIFFWGVHLFFMGVAFGRGQQAPPGLSFKQQAVVLLNYSLPGLLSLLLTTLLPIPAPIAHAIALLPAYVLGIRAARNHVAYDSKLFSPNSAHVENFWNYLLTQIHQDSLLLFLSANIFPRAGETRTEGSLLFVLGLGAIVEIGPFASILAAAAWLLSYPLWFIPGAKTLRKTLLDYSKYKAIPGWLVLPVFAAASVASFIYLPASVVAVLLNPYLLIGVPLAYLGVLTLSRYRMWRETRTIESSKAAVSVGSPPETDSFDYVASRVNPVMPFVDIGDDQLPGVKLDLTTALPVLKKPEAKFLIYEYLRAFARNHDRSADDQVTEQLVYMGNIKRFISRIVSNPLVYYIELGATSNVGERLDFIQPLLETDFQTLVGVERNELSFEEFKRLVVQQLSSLIDEGTQLTFSEEASVSGQQKYAVDFIFNGKSRKVIAYFNYDASSQYPAEISNGYHVLHNAVNPAVLHVFPEVIAKLDPHAGFVVNDVAADMSTAKLPRYKQEEHFGMGNVSEIIRQLSSGQGLVEISSRAFFALGKRLYWWDLIDKRGFPQQRPVLLATQGTKERFITDKKEPDAQPNDNRLAGTIVTPDLYQPGEPYGRVDTPLGPRGPLGNRPADEFENTDKPQQEAFHNLLNQALEAKFSGELSTAEKFYQQALQAAEAQPTFKRLPAYAEAVRYLALVRRLQDSVPDLENPEALKKYFFPFEGPLIIKNRITVDDEFQVLHVHKPLPPKSAEEQTEDALLIFRRQENGTFKLVGKSELWMKKTDQAQESQATLFERGHRYMERTITALLLQGAFKRWQSGFSLSEAANAMYQRLKSNPNLRVHKYGGRYIVQRARMGVDSPESSLVPTNRAEESGADPKNVRSWGYFGVGMMTLLFNLKRALRQLRSGWRLLTAKEGDIKDPLRYLPALTNDLHQLDPNAQIDLETPTADTPVGGQFTTTAEGQNRYRLIVNARGVPDLEKEILLHELVHLVRKNSGAYDRLVNRWGKWIANIIEEFMTYSTVSHLQEVEPELLAATIAQWGQSETSAEALAPADPAVDSEAAQGLLTSIKAIAEQRSVWQLLRANRSQLLKRQSFDAAA